MQVIISSTWKWNKSLKEPGFNLSYTKIFSNYYVNTIHIFQIEAKFLTWVMMKCILRNTLEKLTL